MELQSFNAAGLAPRLAVPLLVGFQKGSLEDCFTGLSELGGTGPTPSEGPRQRFQDKIFHVSYEFESAHFYECPWVRGR